MQEDLKELFPAFERNYAAISTISSNFYVPYVAVWLQSIKNSASDDTNYDVVILEREITGKNKAVLKNFFETKPNFSLRFYNPGALFDGGDLYVSHPYLAIESYFRLGAPVIFKNYKKLILTDSDLIFTKDVKELFNLDTKGAPALSVIEPCWSNWINRKAIVSGIDIADYSKNVLKLEDLHRYFNTGVMLMDIEALNGENYAEKFISKLHSGVKYLYQDQDIINEVLASKMGVLPFEWNGETLNDWSLEKANDDIRQYVFEGGCKKVIHYIGPNKPWKKPDMDLAYIWWEIARQTPFYETMNYRLLLEIKDEVINEFKNTVSKAKTEILNEHARLISKTKDEITKETKELIKKSEEKITDRNNEMIKDVVNYKKYLAKFRKYTFLTNFVFGDLKNRFRDKKYFYKGKVEKVKSFY